MTGRGGHEGLAQLHAQSVTGTERTHAQGTVPPPVPRVALAAGSTRGIQDGAVLEGVAGRVGVYTPTGAAARDSWCVSGTPQRRHRARAPVALTVLTLRPCPADRAHHPEGRGGASGGRAGGVVIAHDASVPRPTPPASVGCVETGVASQGGAVRCVGAVRNIEDLQLLSLILL